MTFVQRLGSLLIPVCFLASVLTLFLMEKGLVVVVYGILGSLLVVDLGLFLRTRRRTRAGSSG